jgi:hypothetical protein
MGVKLDRCYWMTNVALRAFGNRVLRGLFGPKVEHVTGEWRKFREELRDLYSSQTIVRVMKSRWHDNVESVYFFYCNAVYTLGYLTKQFHKIIQRRWLNDWVRGSSWTTTRKTRNTGHNSVPETVRTPTNITWMRPTPNLGLRYQRPSTYMLSHAMICGGVACT